MAKAKGSALVEAVRFLRRQREAARQVLPEALHPYLETRIQLAAWYPEEDLLGLIRALAKLLPGDPREALVAAGQATARQQSEGIYAHLLGPAEDRLSLARRGFALWASQHDSGRLAIAFQGEGVVEVELRDYALPSPEMCLILEGYIDGMLRFAGLGVEGVAKDCCRVGGAATCRWTVRLA
jgi:hypothetical protein